MHLRRKSLAVAAVVIALAVLAAMVIWASGSSTARAAVPQVVDEIPSTIPEAGVTLLQGVADVTLMPSDAQDGSLMAADDAIARAPKVDTSLVPTAILANVTIGSTIPRPGESPNGYENVQDRAAWVITYTYPEPIDVRIGVKYTDSKDAPSPSPLMMTHLNLIIDAQSGEFLLGFFTK